MEILQPQGFMRVVNRVIRKHNLGPAVVELNRAESWGPTLQGSATVSIKVKGEGVLPLLALAGMEEGIAVALAPVMTPVGPRP